MNRATYSLASLALSRSFLSGSHSAAVLRPRLLLIARLLSSSAAPSLSPSSKWFTPSIAVAGGIIAGAGAATHLKRKCVRKSCLGRRKTCRRRWCCISMKLVRFVTKLKIESRVFSGLFADIVSNCDRYFQAYMDYFDVPYKIVEVNPLSKKEIKWSDYKKVPILMVDGQQMNDSSVIIDKLSSMINSEKSAKEVPDNDEEQQWRSWVDNHLVHMLSPNIYRTTSEALESFDYITSNGNSSFTEKYTVKYAGAAAMYFVSKNLKKKYNITDERASLYEAAEQWVNALNGREFLGGTKPNLSDLAVFGVLRPIRYLRSGIDMVENTRIGDWYARMESVVGESSKIVT